MALISSAIPNLVNGVSQQPYTLRLASQAQEQINGLSSVAEGLKKRPPTRHVAKLSDSPMATGFSHVINRDPTEQYVLTITGDGGIQIHDLAGNPRQVNTPNGVDYLKCDDPETELKAVTIADYTFIVNKTVTVKSDPTSKKPRNGYSALIWIKQGAYNTGYSVQVDGVTGLMQTDWSGDNAALQQAAQQHVQTSYIAQQIHDNWVANGGQNNGTTCTQFGSNLYFHNATRDFPVAIFDALGNQSIGLVSGQVQRFEDLPAQGVGGMVVEITGTDQNNFDNYWVEFQVDPANPHGGVWVETTAPEQLTALDNSTMPHILVRDADGTFSFEQAVFDTREVGDDASAPMPSFVDSKINNIVFYRNRLGFLADENIVFSRAGKFFNFWRNTAMQTLDTDPIDVAVTTNQVSILRAAVPFNQTLMLLSDQTQFQLAKTDLLTPKTMGIDVTTSFACDTTANPVNAGNNVYFAQSRGGYSGLREYYVDPVTAIQDATDVTAHCPTYVPGNIRKMASSTNENTIVCLSDKVRDAIYVYRYYWAGNTKAQSSWSKWVLPAGSTVLDVGFINSTLILLISRPDGLYLESMYLASGVVDVQASYQVYLDRRLDQTQVAVLSYGTMQDGSDLPVTYVELPMIEQPGEEYVFVAWAGDATYKQGAVIPYTRTTGEDGRYSYQLRGNVTSFFVGVKYAFAYTFSPFIMRESAPGGQGQEAVTEGRLQIRHCRVSYSQTGYFEAHVTPAAGNTYVYPFTGRVLGVNTNVLGQVALDTSQFEFPVASKNDLVTITLFNDTHLPCAFLGAEWEGFYTIRSRRM
jgi:hypothetical protein